MGRATQTARARGERVRSAAKHLRSPESGLIGEGLRYLIAGATVVAIYVTTTIVLADVVGLHFQIALAIGFATGLATQFTLYRRFVWAHGDFALPAHHQAGRYLAVAGMGYGLSALATAVLPSALGVPTEAVYLGTVVALPLLNFLISRNGIFHADEAPGPIVPEPVPDAPEVEPAIRLPGGS
jgi:putative flippase GtrA